MTILPSIKDLGDQRQARGTGDQLMPQLRLKAADLDGVVLYSDTCSEGAPVMNLEVAK